MFPPSYGSIGAMMEIEGYTDREIDQELWEFEVMHKDAFARILLEAPDGHLDASLKPLIEKWSSPPRAIEVLEVLDKVIHYGAGSGFTVTVLQQFYDGTVSDEGTTHEEVAKLAVWRTM